MNVDGLLSGPKKTISFSIYILLQKLAWPTLGELSEGSLHSELWSQNPNVIVAWAYGGQLLVLYSPEV